MTLDTSRREAGYANTQDLTPAGILITKELPAASALPVLVSPLIVVAAVAVAVASNSSASVP